MKKTPLLLLLAALIFLPYSDSESADRAASKVEIAEKLKVISEQGGDHLGYSGEILSMLENRCGIKCTPPAEDIFDEVDRSDLQVEHTDLYSIFSGGLSLRNSLQLETVTPPDFSGTVDPASLSSPVMKQIPYAEMLKGREYRIFPADRYAPADFYYIHFSDAGRAFETFNFLEDATGALSRRISPVSVDFMTRSKISNQLALKEGPAHQQFYSSAVDEMIITGSDPFIIEGSDVTVIFRPKNQKQLLSTLNEFRRDFKERFRCRESEVTASGVTGTMLAAPGRSVNSCMFVLLDGTVIISNSLKAASVVIDTASGRHPSLAESPDYLYMRSIFPAQKGGEDSFLYISDLFVKHLSSPVLKIREARRMKEAMRMAVLERYAIYYYQVNGKRSTSIEDISSVPGETSLNESRRKELAAIKKNPSYGRSRDLDREYIESWDKFESKLSEQPPQKKKSKKKKRADTGAGTLANAMKVFHRNMTGSSARNPEDVLKLIDLCARPGGYNSRRFEGLTITEGTFTASSAVYGRTGFMTPCIDLESGMVTESEAEDYRDFSRQYGSSGEAYISPAGIKFNIKDGVSAEIFMLRTGDNPFYSFISAFAGGAPVPLYHDSSVKGDVFSAAAKLDPDMIERYLSLNGIKPLGKNGKQVKMSELISGGIQLHIGDTLPQAGFNSSALRQMVSSDGYGSAEAMNGFIIWSLLHPVRLAIPVKNSDTAASAVESIRRQIAEKGNSGNIMRCESFSFEYGGADVKVLKMTILGSLSARVYSAVKNGVLHIATNEKYMKSILDMQKPLTGGDFRGNAAAVLRPSEINQERDMYRSGVIEEGMQKSMRNFGIIKLISLIYPDAPSGELTDLAYRNFAFRPVCPLGGEYTVDKKSGEVVNSVFGAYNSPSIRSGAKENGAAYDGLRRFFSAKEFRAEIEFIHGGMKAKFTTR